MLDLPVALRDRHFDVAVVTDRYPPNAHGGAELSLHIMLSRSADRSGTIVVTFNDDTVAPRHYEIEGVNVLELPNAAPWPYHQFTMCQYNRAIGRRRGVRGLSKLWMIARGVLSLNPLVMIRRVKALHMNYLHPPRGGVVNDFDTVPGGLKTRMLKAALRGFKPKLIHADNYRSIMALGELRPHIPGSFVGLVRDNRFACAAHNQSMMIGTRACGVCNQDCAVVPRRYLSFHQSLMRRTQDFRQRALGRMDRVVVTSEFLEKQIGSFLNKALIYRVANSADDRFEVQNVYRGIPEMPGTNILVIGMLNENKGQVSLVEKLDRLVGQVPDAKIYFAGRGERIRKRITQIAAEKGLADHIEFLGYCDRDELYRWLRRCQIVALPTMWPEPFGRVPLEAGLAIRPVVSYAVGGLRESIIDKKTGILVKPRDTDGFVDAIARLAKDPVRMRKMGYAARDHVARHYKVGALTSRLEEVWRPLMDGKGRR